AVERVLAQVCLVGGVRGVGLALVDPGRVGVVGVLDVVGALVHRGAGPVAQDAVGAGLVLRAGQDHEALVGGQVVRRGADVVVGTGDQRVVGLERDEDGAAALDRLVDAVV